MKTRILMLAALMLFTLVQVAHAKDPFEGTKWKVKLEPTDDQTVKPFEETLSFKGSKLTCTELKKKGFEPANYEDDSHPGLGAFKAELKSEKEGTVKWTGTIAGSETKGDMVWTKKDGTVVNYSFTGEKDTN